MNAPATHIIARQSYRFRLPAGTAPADVQRLCNEELPDRLNTLFDRYCSAGETIRIPKLEVRLELESGDDPLRGLGLRLIAAIEEALQQQLRDRSESSADAEQDPASTILFYLANGFYPWYAPQPLAGTFLDTGGGLDSPIMQIFLREAVPVLAASAAAKHRFAELLTPRLSVILASWLELSAAAAAELMGLMLSAAEADPAGTAIQLRRIATALIDAAIAGGGPAPRRAAFLTAAFAVRRANTPAPVAREPWEKIAELLLLPAETIPVSLPVPEGSAHQDAGGDRAEAGGRPSRETEKAPGYEASTEQQRTRVANAGLVLLAPFLPQLFTTCGLLHEGALQDPGKAIALLRCCAFEQLPAREDELILEKILCGLDLADSPGPLPALSAEDEQECKDMLEAVIANWSVLRQTSPEGLRQSFLQRDGLIERGENAWKLRVQRQTHDILLDFLPWSISIVRTPWMKTMLFVDWTK